MGFILNECTPMIIFVQVFSQLGFWGFILHGAIQNSILRIGIPSWLEGSV
jgi:hypothetical protein